MPLWRSQRENVYRTCSRCGTRQPLSKLAWQNGLLLCSTFDCFDRGAMPIVGSRDVAVAHAMSIWRHELEPDRKLIETVDRKIDLFEVLF